MKITVEDIMSHNKTGPLLAVMRDDVDGHVMMRIAFDYCVFSTRGIGIDTVMLYRIADDKTHMISGEVDQTDCTDSAIAIMRKISRTPAP